MEPAAEPVASAPDRPRCGRALRPADAWCPLCFTPAPSRTFTGPLSTRRCDDPVREARVEHRWTRWERTSVTFGPAGRIGLTLALLAAGPVWLWQTGAGGVVAALLWTVVALPWALRDVWRRVRVRR